MTIKEFWENKETLAIRLRTKEQADMFCRFSATISNKSIPRDIWDVNREESCFFNSGVYCSTNEITEDMTLLEFEDISFMTLDDILNDKTVHILQVILDKVHELISVGVSVENVNNILSSIQQIDLKGKVEGFEEYLKECSDVYSSRDHYTGDYAYAVSEVLKWYRRWFYENNN